MVLVFRVNVLRKVHIPHCAISHGYGVEEHVFVAVRVSSLIADHLDVLLQSQLCIHFSSHLRMLNAFAARPRWFYPSDSIVNSKIMRSFTTGFSDLFVTSVLTGPKMFLSVPCKWSRD